MIKDLSKKVRYYPNLNQETLSLQIGASIYGQCKTQTADWG